MFAVAVSSRTLSPHLQFTGFVQTLEIPGILLFRIPGLKSPGKRHRSWKTMEIPGILKQRVWVFYFCFE